MRLVREDHVVIRCHGSMWHMVTITALVWLLRKAGWEVVPTPTAKKDYRGPELDILAFKNDTRTDARGRKTQVPRIVGIEVEEHPKAATLSKKFDQYKAVFKIQTMFVVSPYGTRKNLDCGKGPDGIERDVRLCGPTPSLETVQLHMINIVDCII